MIIYFADRSLKILGQASTDLPGGIMITEDMLTDELAAGVATFSCKLLFNGQTRAGVEQFAAVGNYLLRGTDNGNELYTITETELDVSDGTLYLYAEDAGLGLLNSTALAFTADEAKPIEFYFNKWLAGTDFSIGLNEAGSTTKLLEWSSEATVTERLLDVATQFDCEIAFSFDVTALNVTGKHVNIYKKRGADNGVQLFMGRDISNITTKSSIENLATCLLVIGGTPSDTNIPVTLDGYSYDDGEYYVDGQYLKARSALDKWGDTGTDGVKRDIIKLFSSDAITQDGLCALAVTQLKLASAPEVNYEVELSGPPKGVKIGDTVYIVDDAGELYLSTRVLKMETSVCDDTCTATFGDFLIKSDGISQRLLALDATLSQKVNAAQKAAADMNARADNGEFNATVLRIDSSRGTVFKNNTVSTVLSAVIYHGSERIIDKAGLVATYGAGAYLEWSWQRMGEDTFGVISASDTRLSNDGFFLTISPADVDTKVTFMCSLITA